MPSPSFTFQERISRIIWIIFLGQLFGSFFPVLLSDKNDRFEIVAQFLVWGLIVVVGYSLVEFFSSRLGLQQILTVVLFSLNLYVALNLLLYILGVEIFKLILPTSDNTSTMLSIIEIQRERVFFPLASGINSFGIIAGVSFVVAILTMRDQNYTRRLRNMAVY